MHNDKSPTLRPLYLAIDELRAEIAALRALASTPVPAPAPAPAAKPPRTPPAAAPPAATPPAK